MHIIKRVVNFSKLLSSLERCFHINDISKKRFHILGHIINTLASQTCFYKGYFLNETVFDSNLAPKLPIEFTLNTLIQGWQIGFQKFKAGGKGKIIVPSVYGYGTQGSGSIPPNTILVFDVELVSFR